jgi:hypothetical protein
MVAARRTCARPSDSDTPVSGPTYIRFRSIPFHWSDRNSDRILLFPRMLLLLPSSSGSMHLSCTMLFLSNEKKEASTKSTSQSPFQARIFTRIWARARKITAPGGHPTATLVGTFHAAAGQRSGINCCNFLTRRLQRQGNGCGSIVLACVGMRLLESMDLSSVSGDRFHHISAGATLVSRSSCSPDQLCTYSS